MALLHQSARMREFQQMNAADGGDQHKHLIILFEYRDGQHWRIGEFVPNISVDQIVVQTNFR